ncbi:MAG: CoA-binding protein [Thermodesulfobacteriota bacterium]
MMNDLMRTVFYPRKVAVIGVSESRDNMGKNIVQNLLDNHFQGEVFPVGPKGGNISGLKIYPSVMDIADEIDFAAIITPATTVPKLVDQCGKKGARAIYIATGGFREFKIENIDLEADILNYARKHNVRLIGPNCVGVINTEIGLCLPFQPVPPLKIGPVSVLSQSGGVANGYLMLLFGENIGVNKWVSMGNKLDLEETDFLSYLIEDPWTQVICVHSEGLNNGRRLLELAQSSSKPIILHKVNKFETSVEVAKSHTAAIANDNRIIDAICLQGRIIRAETIENAINYAKVFLLPKLTGNRLAVMTRSGGHGVIAADFCAKYGFEMSPYEDDYLKKIQEFFRAKVIKTANPLDLGDLWNFESYRYILENAIKQEQFDGMLFVFTDNLRLHYNILLDITTFLSELMRRYSKPIAFVFQGWKERVDRLKESVSFPVFYEIDETVESLAISRDFYQKKNNS